MMRRLWRGFLGLATLALLYLLFWPIPVEPVAWKATPSAGYVGAYAPNDRLAGLASEEILGRNGPEDAAIGADGALYVTTHEGDVLRRGAEGWSVFAATGGRPLGIEAGPDGALWVADAYRGLMRVTAEGAALIADRTTAGDRIGYANSLDFAPDGAVWMTDASTRFPAADWGGTLQASYLEILEHGRSGRILRIDPETGAAEVKHAGISFANGLAIGPTGEWLFYVETGETRLMRLWIAGQKAGTAEPVLENLPGYPDNLKRDAAGGFLLGLVSKRAPLVDLAAGWPFLRKMVWRLPAALRPKAVSYGFILRLSDEGEVVETWQDPEAGYPLTTGAVRGAEGGLWVTSLSADRIGRLAAP